MKRKLFLSAILALTTALSMSAQIEIEAENFSRTAGTYAGFKTYQVSGASGGVAINYNQTGDYAMYQLPSFYQSGKYSLTYYISTAANNAGVEFSIMSPSHEDVITTAVPNNGDWNTFTPLVSSEDINLINGDTYMFIIKSVGSEGAWQWNLDKIVLTRVGNLDFPLEGINTITSNPVSIKTGAVAELKVGVTPTVATNQNLTWASSNPSVVSVPSEGYILTNGGGPTPVVPRGEVSNYITGEAEGTATITATSEEGGFVASFNVTVFDTHSFEIEAEAQSSPYSNLGTHVPCPTGTAVEVTSNASKLFTFLTGNIYYSYSKFLGKSGEYSIEYLVKTNNSNTVITFESIQTEGALAPVSMTLPNTHDTYQWVSLPQTIGFEDGRNTYNFALEVSGTDEVRCTIDKIKFTKSGVLNVPAEGLEIEGTSDFTLEPGQFSSKATVKFTPWYTSNQKVVWSSSDASVVNVNAEGYIQTMGGGENPVVQTGKVENFFEALSVGTATITATSEDGNFVATFSVNVQYSDPVVFEAESFAHTAGSYNGFTTYQLSGASQGVAINNNQTGDWATYTLPAGMESGVYKVDYYISTPLNGAQIGFAVDYGDLAMVDSVPNNGSWDSFTKLTASQTVVIDASSVGAVQVKSVGAAGAWQWNLDYFVLSKVADLAQLKSHTAVEPVAIDDIENALKTYPTKVESSLTIDFSLAAETNVSVEVIDMQGQLKASVISNNIYSKGDNSLSFNASNLSKGTYLVRMVAGEDVLISKFVK